MHQTLLDHGELHIADYGLQRTWLMRTLFRSVIQNLDGRTNTEPNARGVLPELMRAAGFSGRQGGIGHSHTQRLYLPVSRDPAVKNTDVWSHWRIAVRSSETPTLRKAVLAPLTRPKWLILERLQNVACRDPSRRAQPGRRWVLQR